MKFISFVGSSIFQILSIFFVLGFLFGILNIHFSDKNEYCVMTYMFEYPQFVHVTVSENKIYPQYGLYAYSEGRFTERARKMWFDGVPVLFLPGNSGSHMQARSLASVALRKALSGPQEYHFDYFTIDYNEELSGLYGGVLQSQTQYTAACISRILSLYKSNRYTKYVPTSVILIGHSMGGVIAKRLLAYPATINSTSIALTLAAPLEAPAINFDSSINDYYMLMSAEWEELGKDKQNSESKILLSFGNGPRDILMPSSLTSSKDSYISALATAIPGVWVSPDHVGIVWCKQLVMAINKYLFDIVDLQTEQVSKNMQILTSKAREYFQANRSMTLSPEIARPNVAMVADAFWYEDNRRIYQIARPHIDKTTYLMIRLVNYPQNRFVAVETVNVSDKDWVFGCNAMYTYNTYRYCKQATSLTELSRWSGAAIDFGKRKLATVNLHSIMKHNPEWTHVVFKVSPTRKPITLNVDVNDYASRQITVKLPSVLSFGTTVVKQDTEPNSLYYELILPGFNAVYQAYLLYVEPTSTCKAIQYHVSAEVHVPWAKNNEYYHYFTHLNRSPMKLRLYNSNPNITYGLHDSKHVKVTLLLDPQCTYTISISSTWYHSLAQIARNYSPVLIAYVAAVILLAARSNILSLKEHGRCMTMHGALMSEGVKPYYVLVCARLVFMLITSVPSLTYIMENASWSNVELVQFSRSLLVTPAYMTALGIVHLAAAAILGVMVFSSQLAHRLFFRIVWRGGNSMAERVASGLQRMPYIVIVVLVAGVPLSCGAASLVAGAAFYAFISKPQLAQAAATAAGYYTIGCLPLVLGIVPYAFTLSKMYEEYLEDYVYKIMANVAAKMCKMFKSKKRSESESDTSLVPKEQSYQETSDLKAIEAKSEVKEESEDIVKVDNKETDIRKDNAKETASSSNQVFVSEKDDDNNLPKREERPKSRDIDEDLNNLNFHMMMFFLWMCVTLVNVPALLTWARNFKYSMVLKPDTSYHVGLMMSVYSACLWQMSGPRSNLKHYDIVASLLFTTAVFIIVLGPFSLTVVNYGVTFMYIIITLQQLMDLESETSDSDNSAPNESDTKNSNVSSETKSENIANDGDKAKESNQAQNDSTASSENNTSDDDTGETSEDCTCNESRIYTLFKNLRDKFDFSGNES